MKYVSIFFITGLLFILPGCSSSQEKSSPLDGYWTDKGKTISHKKFTVPMKWAAGQYNVTGYFENGKKEYVTKTTIVRKEQTGWVYEFIAIDKKGKISGMQALLEGYEDAVANKDKTYINIIWVKMLNDDGTVQKIDGDMVAYFNTVYRYMFDQIVFPKQAFRDGGTLTVPAGTFKGTTMVSGNMDTTLAKQKAAGVYFHPDVPINGMLKAVDDKGNVIMELLDFGNNGKAVIE